MATNKTSDKKRVLIISCWGLGKGGVQNVMMNIARRLSHKYTFDFLVFAKDSRYYDSEAERYGNIYRIPHKNTRLDYYIRFFRIFFGIRKILKENKYDIVHCNNSFESGICCLAAAMSGVKTRVVHTHTTENSKGKNIIRKFIDEFYRFLLNKFSNVKIACSQKSAESFFYKSQSVNICCNSIDLSIFNTDGRKSHGNINFIHIGTLNSNKNQVFIIKVIEKLKKFYPNLKLTLVGEDFNNYKIQIEKEIKKYNLENNVIFLPFDSDIPRILKESDYMIFPSISEGLPLTVLEAQACGVFCFVSNAVTCEANAGMCNFYSITDSPQMWAHRIRDFIEKNTECNADMSLYDLNRYIVRMDFLYRGEKSKCL